MKFKRLLSILLPLALLSLLMVDILNVKAQSRGDWTTPYRLSTENSEAAEAALAVDNYGYVHAFWPEQKPDTRSTIEYARFDGETWSIPNDIHVTAPDDLINNISVAIDNNNILHVVWTEGLAGRTMYTSAPAYQTSTAKNWPKALRLGLPPAGESLIQVDSNGIFHVLYTVKSGDSAGLYYVKSMDSGLIWSSPVWIDPDIPPNNAPGSVQFDLDQNNNLHAAWYYVALDFTGADWVRYSHSLDGGTTWSAPFTIDKLDESVVTGPDEGEKTLSSAQPRMIVNGETVHIIWAGGQLHYRNHRYSLDAGQTWSLTARVFGDLNGQAGDGFAIDEAGRVHFFSQIRQPRGIYHMVWDHNQWTTPELIYLISLSDGDPIGSRIHAHRTFPAIRAGNQIVLTFTDPPGTPGRRLFSINRTLDDLPALPLEPTPVTTEEAREEVIPASTPTTRVTQALGDFEGNDVIESNSVTTNGIWIGSMLSLVMILGTLGYWMLFRHRH